MTQCLVPSKQESLNRISQVQADVRKNEVDPLLTYLKEKSLLAIKNLWELAQGAEEESIIFQANKYLVDKYTKLSGLDVEKVEHSGTVAFEPLKLSREVKGG